MLTAGVDVGAATTKAVILRDRDILSSYILPTGADVTKSALRVINESTGLAGLTFKDLDAAIATGYGRHSVPYAQKAVTEILCHAKGARFLLPETRMVIDIGGQDSKVILVGDNGEVKDFIMNDKCAAGTGRFLEVIANVLELEIEDLGTMSLRSKTPCQITSTCTVFAESEVVSLRAEKKAVKDIVAGIHQSAAKRVVSMATPMGIAQPIVFTGGVANNQGVRRAMERELRTELIVPHEPQLVGALGAAIFASDLKR